MVEKIRGIELFTESGAYSVLETRVSGTGKKVMLAILREMTKDLNVVTVNGDTLNRICESCGISTSQVRKAVSELKKFRLIEPTRQLRAEYVVTPTLAIKGDSKKVWKFYGELENILGNVQASVVSPGLSIPGKSVTLTEEDLSAVGAFVKGVK